MNFKNVLSNVHSSSSYTLLNLYQLRMLGLAAGPALIQFIGFLYLPESPRWLVAHDRLSDAKQILSKIRGTDDVSNEIASIREMVEKEKLETQAQQNTSTFQVQKKKNLDKFLNLNDSQ